MAKQGYQSEMRGWSMICSAGCVCEERVLFEGSGYAQRPKATSINRVPVLDIESQHMVIKISDLLA